VARLVWQGWRGVSTNKDVVVAGVSPAVAAEIRQVYDICAGVEFAEQLVQAAQSPESALHNLFTWDNDEAAAEWRLEQARGLVRRVHVRVIRGETQEPIRVRAYVARRELPAAAFAPAGSFVAIEEVAGATEWEASVLYEISREVTRLRRKYDHVADFFKRAVLDALAE
jgi:hypothetical protein